MSATVKLVATRGLPGAGKSTRARLWVSEDPIGRARINRDDIRAMLNDSYYSKENGGTERVAIAVRDASIKELLERGVDVVNDDTNLRSRNIRDLRRLAELNGAEFEVWDMTDVSLEDCLHFNHIRTDKPPLDESVITDLFNRFIRPNGSPLPIPQEKEDDGSLIYPYRWTAGLPTATICDIDGTVALKGNRDPFDEASVNEDRPNPKVIRHVILAQEAGDKIIFVSGRTSGCYEATHEWLRQYVTPDFELWMRAPGDTRQDSIVKAEIFNTHIRPRYNVQSVFDDRDQVVKMWRQMGLVCFQVAEGNF